MSRHFGERSFESAERNVDELSLEGEAMLSAKFGENISFSLVNFGEIRIPCFCTADR